MLGSTMPFGIGSISVVHKVSRRHHQATRLAHLVRGISHLKFHETSPLVKRETILT